MLCKVLLGEFGSGQSSPQRTVTSFITDIIYWYSYEKGGMHMLTPTDIAIIIGIIGLCLTCYGIGYTAGKDSTQKHR